MVSKNIFAEHSTHKKSLDDQQRKTKKALFRLKRNYPVPVRINSRSTKKKLGKRRNTSHGKVSEQSLVFLSEMNIWEASEGCFGVQRRLINNESQKISGKNPVVLIRSILVFVLVAASVYNKRLKNQSFDKQESPSYLSQ